MENKTTLLCVKGRGQIKLKPDLTIFEIIITGHGKNYKLAKERLLESVNDLFATLSDLEIDKQYVTSGYIDIKENWVYPPKDKPRYKDGYNYKQTITIRYPRELNYLGKLLSVELPYECNIYYDISDPSQRRTEILALAAKNAREKAEAVCGELNLEVVGIESVNVENAVDDFDITLHSAKRRYHSREDMLLCESAPSFLEEDFSPSETTLSGEVNVRFVAKYKRNTDVTLELN